MRVINVNNGQNFGATVKVGNQYKDMLNYGLIKNLHNQLKNSGTNNVYEMGKSTFSNPQKTNGKHELLLNGEKFDELVQSPSEGTFGLLQNFLKKCLDKETALLPEQNPEIAAKLDKIREVIKETGLALENVKTWL